MPLARTSVGKRVLHGLAVLCLAVGVVVPVMPQSQATAQAMAAAKNAAAKAAARQGARRGVATARAGRAARADRQPDLCRATRNKCLGIARERSAYRILADRYPSARIQSETFLRNRDGSLARDPVTGKARRIDFVLFFDGGAVKRFEITSQRSDKRAQFAQERRIITYRRDGQRRTDRVYVFDRETRRLVPIGEGTTEIMRFN
jgi:hypothetical protein